MQLFNIKSLWLHVRAPTVAVSVTADVFSSRITSEASVVKSVNELVVAVVGGLVNPGILS
jgi:hypothetical protein